MKITWLGHAAYRVETDKAVILIIRSSMEIRVPRASISRKPPREPRILR